MGKGFGEGEENPWAYGIMSYNDNIKRKKESERYSRSLDIRKMQLNTKWHFISAQLQQLSPKIMLFLVFIFLFSVYLKKGNICLLGWFWTLKTEILCRKVHMTTNMTFINSKITAISLAYEWQHKVMASAYISSEFRKRSKLFLRNVSKAVMYCITAMVPLTWKCVRIHCSLYDVVAKGSWQTSGKLWALFLWVICNYASWYFLYAIPDRKSSSNVGNVLQEEEKEEQW